MSKLQRELGLEEQPDVRDYFDIVAGTGTGAVIACMVGRLGVSVAQAIEYYARLAKVFSERKLIGPTLYKVSKLQDVLKGIVRDITGDADASMIDINARGTECRTMVFAMSENSTNGLPCIFRSYPDTINQMPDCPIWEVLSATMAHPDMFKPVDIGPENPRLSFVDGGLGCNNLTAHVLTEAKAILADRYLSSLICIGAGHPDTIRLIPIGTNLIAQRVPISVLELTRRPALDAERVAQEMEKRFQSTPGIYFRFSVDQGIQGIKLSEWENLSRVGIEAKAYMQGPEVGQRVHQAVFAIQGRKKIVKIANTNLPASYKICPKPTPVFTGRQETIDQIVACISKGDTQRCVLFLHGLGGSGKTQLALKTAQQTIDMWSDVVFVDATSREAAAETLARFAIEKGIGESHETALRWLGDQQERWLMIIDNADDPDVDIRRYFPRSNRGSILITTRIKRYTSLAEGYSSDIQVSEMQPEEAMMLLLRAAKIKNTELSTGEREATIKLLKDLGYLALAVLQAGAYIFRSKCSIAQYCEMLTLHRQTTLEKYSRLPIRIDDYQKSVYTTWHMSYTLLSTNAKQLLHLMAFMRHSDIIEDIFRRFSVRIQAYAPEIPASGTEREIRTYVTTYFESYIDSTGVWDSSAFSQTMAEMLSYSLVSYDKVDKTYSFHILVHDWAATMVDHPIAVAIEHTAFLLAVSIDYEDTLESLDYKRRVETHVSKLLGQQQRPNANNASPFAEVYRRSGKWNQVEKMEQIVVDGRREALGEEDPATLESMNNLANTYQGQGRYQEAAALLEQVVMVQKRALGYQHRQTLISLRSLASTYYNLGRYTDAQSLYLHILDTSERVYGHDHPDTLSIMHELARLYQAQGRYDETVALLVRVVDSRTQLSGDEHPSTLSSLQVLASIYYDQCRYDEAESMQVHVLEVMKRRIGDEHPDTLDAMSNLALTYYAKGQYDEAESVQVNVLAGIERVYGKDHPVMFNNMKDLANTYCGLLNIRVVGGCVGR
ncbi:kinesin light chain [Ceratobasidium sp. AG-Ba]|nr:kinesin light chain [Ceratobasidium sp. AG-Ba]